MAIKTKSKSARQMASEFEAEAKRLNAQVRANVKESKRLDAEARQLKMRAIKYHIMARSLRERNGRRNGTP